MARPGRPRKHDPVADDISFDIERAKDDVARKAIEKHGIDILDGDARTPLIWASFHNRQDLLEWLISKGANVDHQDRNGYCALHFAGQEKHAGITKILLDADASTELRDVYGNTPLWTAAFNARGDYDVVNALLSQGASLDNKNNAGKTIRDLATTLFPEVLKSLIANAR